MDTEKRTLAAVVLSGYSPQEEDPLAAFSLGRPKGLIPIAGRPMLAYVIEALMGSRYIGPVIVVGLPPNERPPLPASVIHLPAQGDILDNAEAGLHHALSLHPDLEGVLISSSDLPLLTPAIVDQFIEDCLKTDHDLYYGVVERSVMEGRFPTSRRTYVRFADGEFAGGDLLLVRSGATTLDRELWRRLAQARKSPLRQARMLGGPWALFKLLTGRMCLAEGERRASQALRVRGRAVVCSCAEVGMDVDKPFQLEIVRAELEARFYASTS